jgi:hypothetical protein
MPEGIKWNVKAKGRNSHEILQVIQDISNILKIFPLGTYKDHPSNMLPLSLEQKDYNLESVNGSNQNK